MTGTVSRKSQYGFQVDGGSEWINYGNYYQGTRDFEKGDTIEYEANGKYLVSLAVKAKGNGSAAKQAKKAKCPSCGFEF